MLMNKAAEVMPMGSQITLTSVVTPSVLKEFKMIEILVFAMTKALFYV